jgi:hypothetical protein
MVAIMSAFPFFLVIGTREAGVVISEFVASSKARCGEKGMNLIG